MSAFHEPAPARPPSLWKREAPALMTGAVLLIGSVVAVPYLIQRWHDAAPYRAQMAAEREAERARIEAEAQAQSPIEATPPQVPAPRPDLGPPPDAPVVRYPAFVSQPSFELPASVGRRTPGIIWVYFDCKVTTQGRLTDCDITESPAGAGAAVYMSDQLHRVRVSPMTVDGRAQETRMNFHIRFSGARSTGATPPPAPPAPAPREAAPAVEPSPPPDTTSAIAESIRSKEPALTLPQTQQEAPPTTAPAD